MSMKNIFKWSSLLVGVWLVGYIGYFYYSLATGKERVTAICNQITVGMTIDDLSRLARQHDLGPSMLRADAKLVFLAESSSYGRHACRVEITNGVVKSANYVSAS